MLTDVPVDGGSSVNILTEETTFKIGFSQLDKTLQILGMAYQSRVVQVGRLNQVATVIGGLTFLLDFVIIKPPLQFRPITPYCYEDLGCIKLR